MLQYYKITHNDGTYIYWSYDGNRWKCLGKDNCWRKAKGPWQQRELGEVIVQCRIHGAVMIKVSEEDIFLELI